jgi:L-alanine-DL-glutamate epimerase-like enolase superfamily enzyme
MKITDVRIRELSGSTQYSDDLFQGRQRWPMDIYPEAKARTAQEMYKSWSFISDGNNHQVKGVFVEIDTDEGITGIAGPINWMMPAIYIQTIIRPLLLGKDPFATELIWDQMYRSSNHGRKGFNMHAISYIDIALWDIKGKAFNVPVCSLLGGPVQQKIPAYASTVGFSLDLENVFEKVKQFRSEGYTATKWFVTEGPTDGPEGERKNVSLMKTIREAAGPDMKVMLDAWSSWDVPYTLKMAKLMEEYNPYWFEEPVLTDLPDSYARLRRECPIQISGGEHEFTRWGSKLLMDKQCCDIYQMDPVWCGGISEMTKICTLASVYDVPVIPHGTSQHVNAHISFAQNAVVVPMMEDLVAFRQMSQHFLAEPLKPVDGYFTPPTAPGMGLDIDESKIESEKQLSWN